MDNTLSPSRSKIDPEMAELLKELLKHKQVAIITGEAFVDIEKQVLTEIGRNDERNKNLILLPTNGGGLFTFTGDWQEISAHKFTTVEKERIINAIKEVDQADPTLCGNISYGAEIQDRGAEITYAALGKDAPLGLKEDWDPNFKKRIILQQQLEAKLPEFEVKIGGKTSIDITPKGLDKAYGIRKLLELLNLDMAEILFVGDSVYEHGNDYPVKQMGVETVAVSNPEETKALIRQLLKR